MGKSGKPSKSKKSKKKSSSSHTRKRLRVNPPKAAQAEENGGRAAVGIPEASSVGTSSAASSTTASRDCSQSLSSSSEECSSSSDSDSNSDSSSGSGVASKSDRFKWTLDLESALVEAYNQLPNRTADNNLKKSEWTIVQSSFNKGSGQNASVKQLISKWNRITSDFDTLKKLRSSDGGSGWGWDDVKGMLVQPSKVVWEEWIKAGRNRRRFKKLKFPFYDTVDGLVGGTRATGKYTPRREDSPDTNAKPKASSESDTFVGESDEQGRQQSIRVRERSAVVRASNVINDGIKAGISSLVAALGMEKPVVPTFALSDNDECVMAVRSLNTLADEDPATVDQNLLLSGSILLMGDACKARLFNNIHHSIRLTWLLSELNQSAN